MVMSRDEIRAAIDAQRDGSGFGPRSFNELADLTGVKRSTMRAALAPRGSLSRRIAEKCTNVLGAKVV